MSKCDPYRENFLLTERECLITISFRVPSLRYEGLLGFMSSVGHGEMVLVEKGVMF